ncbi:hypothetical protein Pcinc_034204 [Petrolisthes cinctipes]|uniref:Methyltransferase domain-containing protein n=1 Tax=Petrolisthes cinctipes TaxID=88211 RepID=A0AAE1EQS9_PETCI|nr:hypothetical protein Pcinc_034204 [Petrolisthes cinctipes]
MTRVSFISVTPLTLYMLALILYGSLMTLTSLTPKPEPPTTHTVTTNYQDEDQLPQLSNRAKRSHSRWLREAKDFYHRVRIPETYCSKVISVGGTRCKGNVDNNKYVCLDPDVALNSSNCTIYSFGIGYDVTFDDQMSYFGCEVHMFDPTINHSRLASQLQPHQHFYHIGLDAITYNKTFVWNNEDDDKPGDVIVGDFDTWDHIRAHLHHQNTPVHYLKLDIEGYEWRILEELGSNGRLAGVKQLAIELHTSVIIDYPDYKVLEFLMWFWDKLEALHRQGFLRAIYQPTLVEESMYTVPGNTSYKIPTCFELLYLRRGPVY